jgi:hypothetical protein
MLRSLLTSGIIEYEGKIVDFSHVQVIRIQDGIATFNPPAKLETDVGPVRVKTTISQLTVKNLGIKVEVDRSIIDLELRPA